MPMIREKAPRTRNANVTLKLTLTEDEVTKLRKQYGEDHTLSQAITDIAMTAINKFFSGK